MKSLLNDLYIKLLRSFCNVQLINPHLCVALFEFCAKALGSLESLAFWWV